MGMPYTETTFETTTVAPEESTLPASTEPVNPEPGAADAAQEGE